MRMFTSFVAAAVLASGVVLAAQDEKIPDDSALVTLRGCARGSNFVVGPRSEDQPGTLDIEPGRRFRLTGAKKLLDDIKRHERNGVQVTGVIRKADIQGPQGVSVLGGRVRIGGAPRPQDPISDPARDPAYAQAVLEVRSWRQTDAECRR